MEIEDKNSVQSALIAGEQIAAISPRTMVVDGVTHVLVRSDMSLAAIPPQTPVLPKRVKATASLIEQGSFCDYINRYKTSDTVIIANPGCGMQSTLDYHGMSGSDIDQAIPNYCEHRAVFETGFDLNFQRWREIDGKKISQLDFAYFVEEMMHTIGAPDGAGLLEMAQELKVVRGVTFKSNSRIKDGNVDIAYQTDDQTVGGKSGVLSVPDEITIVSPVYLLRPTQAITAKLRYRVEPGEPLSFIVQILNRKLIEFEAFKLMADEVGKATNAPVFLGQY
jgi:hypothetical protein